MKRKVVPTESVPAQWWVMVLPRQSVPGWVLAWAWRSERRKPELNHTKNQEDDKVSASGHSRTHAHYGATWRGRTRHGGKWLKPLSGVAARAPNGSRQLQRTPRRSAVFDAFWMR